MFPTTPIWPIIAAGNITATNGSALIDTHSTTGSAGNIYIIAGADLSNNATSGGGSNPGGITIPGGYNITAGSVGVNFYTLGTGGDIDLSASTAGTVINSSSTAGNGGSVILLTFKGTGGGGHVTLSSSGAINASSTAVGGNGGNVSIIAGANDTSAIATGSITSGSGSGGTSGSVTIVTAQPQAVANTGTQARFNLVADPDGAIIDTSAADYTITNTAARVNVGNINVSGGGGVANSGNGGNAGNITIAAGSGVITGSLDAWGGGGGGGMRNQGTRGGNGGNGGQVTVSSAGGAVNIVGDINVSGGGGGGGDYGGYAGVGGSVIVSASTTLSIDGPVLAAGGGNGSYSGGGSFGGGGGAAGASAYSGGGGFYGGGSTQAGSAQGGGGGGINGGGAGGNPGNSGTIGTGGDGAVFGMPGGSDASTIAMSGNNGSISLTGSSIDFFLKTISGAFSGLSPSFAATRFANSALVAGNITFQNASTMNITGDIQSSGGTVTYSINTPTNKVVLYGPSPSTVNLVFSGTGAITLPPLENQIRFNTFSVNTTNNQDVTINSDIAFDDVGTLTVVTGGGITFAGLSPSTVGDTINLSATNAILVNGDVILPSGYTPDGAYYLSGTVTATSSTAGVTVQNVDVSGLGGAGETGTAYPFNGGRGGTITLKALGTSGDIETRYLRAYGGGGGGGLRNQGTRGGTGGNGGQVTVSSAGGAVNIVGDINVSGGGGGGGDYGGYAGVGGSVIVSACTTLSIDGPVLAAGGGNGSYSGGGSFGGGGGAVGASAYSGGGGFYGGGSTQAGSAQGGGGGGINGGGAGGNPGNCGTIGTGGDGAVCGMPGGSGLGALLPCQAIMVRFHLLEPMLPVLPVSPFQIILILHFQDFHLLLPLRGLRILHW